MKIMKDLFLNLDRPQAVRPYACKVITTLISGDRALRYQALLQIVLPGFQILFNSVASTLKMYAANTEPNSPNQTTPSSQTHNNESPSSVASLPKRENTATKMSPFTPIRHSFPEMNSPVPNRTLPQLAKIWKYSLEGLDILMEQSLLNAGTAKQNEDYISFFADLFEDIVATIVNSMLLFLIPEQGAGLDEMLREEIAMDGMNFMVTLVEIGC